MALTIPDICALYERHGGRMYSGEPVTQLEHALQSAALAEATGADAELITAALLHDLGHLLNDQGDTPTARGIDDAHQHFALPFLRGLFDDRVLEPIRLHVDAKRYLCATRPGYHDALSPDSKRSLALQGGTFSTAEAAEKRHKNKDIKISTMLAFPSVSYKKSIDPLNGRFRSPIISASPARKKKTDSGFDHGSFFAVVHLN